MPSIKTWLGTGKDGVELVDLKGLVGSVENRLVGAEQRRLNMTNSKCLRRV